LLHSALNMQDSLFGSHNDNARPSFGFTSQRAGSAAVSSLIEIVGMPYFVDSRTCDSKILHVMVHEVVTLGLNYLGGL
jgi:hypothetical protein